MKRNGTGLKRARVEIIDAEGRPFQLIDGHFSRYGLKKEVSKVLAKAGEGSTSRIQHDGVGR